MPAGSSVRQYVCVCGRAYVRPHIAAATALCVGNPRGDAPVAVGVPSVLLSLDTGTPGQSATTRASRDGLCNAGGRAVTRREYQE